jgi:ABC-2 type transport system ATP-binding protein
MQTSRETAPPVLELFELGKTYGRGDKARQAVRDVSLIVRAGQVYGFLGPNGAGKSTTIRMILGLIAPTHGRLSLFGGRLDGRAALARVGSLIDGGAFYPFLTGRENLKTLALTRGLASAPIDGLLARVDLAADADRKVKSYSLGMRQRLGVAAALLNDPDLVILDEPANGLDAAGIQDMRQLVRVLADEGKAVFLSSHLLHEVQQVCDRVAIINKGRLLQEGSVAEILAAEQVLRLRAQPADLARAVLQPTWSVHDEADGLYVSATPEEAPAIVRRLVEAGVEVFSIAPREANLEAIFLEMTRSPNA